MFNLTVKTLVAEVVVCDSLLAHHIIRVEGTFQDIFIIDIAGNSVQRVRLVIISAFLDLGRETHAGLEPFSQLLEQIIGNLRSLAGLLRESEATIYKFENKMKVTFEVSDSPPLYCMILHHLLLDFPLSLLFLQLNELPDFVLRKMQAIIDQDHGSRHEKNGNIG